MKAANFTDLSPDPSSSLYTRHQSNRDRKEQKIMFLFFFSDGKEQVVHLGLVLGSAHY